MLLLASDVAKLSFYSTRKPEHRWKPRSKPCGKDEHQSTISGSGIAARVVPKGIARVSSGVLLLQASTKTSGGFIRPELGM